MKTYRTIASSTLVFMTCVLFLNGCSRSRTNEPVSPPQPIAEITLEVVPEFRIESLNKANRKEFEKTLPTDVREAFDSAAKITIVFTEERVITIEEPRVKRALLDALYWDLAKSIPTDPNVSAVACKGGPSVQFYYQDENLMGTVYMINPSYTCGWIDIEAGSRSYSRLLTVKEPISRRIISQLTQKHFREP